MKNQQIKAILFDFDGTLAESLGTLEQTYYQFLGQFRITGTTAEFASLNGPSLPEIVQILAAKYGLLDSDPIESLQARYFEMLEQNYAASVRPVPGASQLLQRCRKQLRVALVTSAPRTLLGGILDRFNWTSMFEVIVTGDEVRQSKPDPQIYKCALERMHLIPDQAIAVEDSVNGVIAASSAGLKVVAVEHGNAEQLLKAGAAAVVPTLHELPGELSRMSRQNPGAMTSLL